MAARVHQLIRERINPGLAAHGGRATLLEATIKSEIPQITEVLDTTDHASGTNPYYQGT